MTRPSVLTLPLDTRLPRRWSVGHTFGDAFGTGEDFKGIILTLEIHNADEARAVATQLCATMPIQIDPPAEQEGAA